MEEVENDPTNSDEQKQLYRDRLDDLNTEKKARLEIKKIFKHKSQESGKPLKRFLIKTPLWQKESVPYFVNKVLPYFQY